MTTDSNSLDQGSSEGFESAPEASIPMTPLVGTKSSLDTSGALLAGALPMTPLVVGESDDEQKRRMKDISMTPLQLDVIFMALTIASYRASVDHLILGYPSETILRYIYLADIGIFYFIIRELGKAISLCMITNRPSIYFLSFWNLIDLWSTLLLLASVVTLRVHLTVNPEDDTSDVLRSLMSIATGFFSLRVLNFLKGINMQLATFVLAIIHITRDVVWFGVILLALVVAFAQMFFTLLAPAYCTKANDPNLNATDYDIKDYPECVQAEYYLKIYSIFIFQEFDRKEYTTVFSVLLIVLYSFMVVLVLLNVLIAVASDSYEKCLVSGQNLFGRARVQFAAELVSFQNLLRRNSTAPGVYKGWGSRSSAIAGWSRGSVVFFSLCLLVIVIWMIAETVVYLLSPDDVNLFMSMGSVCQCCTLCWHDVFFYQWSRRHCGTPQCPQCNGCRKYSTAIYFLWFHEFTVQGCTPDVGIVG